MIYPNCYIANKLSRFDEGSIVIYLETVSKECFTGVGLVNGRPVEARKINFEEVDYVQVEKE